MDSRLAYCIGLYQGDGGIGINRVKRKTSKGIHVHDYWYIHFGSTDKYLTEEFNEGFGLGKQILVSHDNRKDTYKDYYRVNCHNKEVVDYLKSLGYLDRKNVDIGILTSALKGYEWEFLQGFMDADGYVTDKSNGNYIEWVSDDKRVSDFVYKFIWNSGIKCSQYQRPTKTETIMYSVRVPQSAMKGLYPLLFSYKPRFVSRKHERFLRIIEEN